MFQIGNERVALVTDTSCDLSDEQLSQYDIRTVALRVATSQGEFRDRLEITQEQLYDLLQREVPKTSLPLPEDVSNLYRTLHDVREAADTVRLFRLYEKMRHGDGK